MGSCLGCNNFIPNFFIKMDNSRPSISIIIIGDEILKGQTIDTNSHFLCRELFSGGIKVSSISVIPDDVDAIASEVAKQSSLNAFVITSGGVGPTHDDITYEAVAKAFNLKLVLNEELEDLLGGSNSKMVYVAESSKVHIAGNPFSPIVCTRNVFMFPGIPSYLQSSFKNLKHLFCAASVPFITRALYLRVDEFEIVDSLNLASEEYKDSVSLGSYPYVDNRWYRVKLALDSDSNEAVINAEAFLRSHLPQNLIIGEHPPTSEESLNLLREVYDRKMRSTKFMKFVKDSWDILHECFNKYPLESVCLSFNGGKDCTALLHLTVLLLRHLKGKVPSLKALYVESEDSFPETEQFVKMSVNRYNLELISYKHPIQTALSYLKSDHPEIQAVLMGSRRTDPKCSVLEPFQETDKGWPKFMRVSPLAEWTYPEVWKFLKVLDVPYCSLYDRGYTSLGCRHNTLPNEQLLATTKGGDNYYLPAYLLKEPEQEREGRT